MYYTGLDPRTMEEVYVPKNPHEKAMQRALIQYRNPKNYDLVYEALVKAGREDLIGFDKRCLIRPRNIGYGHPGAQGAGGYAGKSGQGTGAKGGKSGQGKGAGYNQGAAPRQNNGKNAAPAKKKTIRNVHKKKG